MVDTEAVKARIAALKTTLWHDEAGQRLAQNVQGGIQSALSILALLYGPSSLQVKSFLERLKKGSRDDYALWQYEIRIAGDVEAVLDAAIADLEAGLTAPVREQAKGEVLGDFLGLARHALDEANPETERVAAVLVAAALEETLKQLAESKGLDVYDRDMRGVIQKLKDAQVLLGAQSGIATGLVKFRDHAFHGQFDQIQRAGTESAYAFVQGLLASQFA